MNNGAAGWQPTTWVPPRGGTRVWGPSGWDWLHRTAISYPPRPSRADAAAAGRALGAFFGAIECDLCRDHIAEFLQRCPPEIASGASFQEWARRFHNEVNVRLGKAPVSRSDYLEIWGEEIRAAELRYEA